uniref:Uncharacterized protein n=1 Tax=Arundo donax TaxID=35708 RepID=A0A0A9F9G4_ARUDO
MSPGTVSENLPYTALVVASVHRTIGPPIQEFHSLVILLLDF